MDRKYHSLGGELNGIKGHHRCPDPLDEEERLCSIIADHIAPSEQETPVKSLFNEKVTVGIDIGIKDFAILSNGEK